MYQDMLTTEATTTALSPSSVPPAKRVTPAKRVLENYFKIHSGFGMSGIGAFVFSARQSSLFSSVMPVLAWNQ